MWSVLPAFPISGLKSKKTVYEESYLKQFILYWIPLVIAVYLLGPDERFGNSLLRGNFISHTNLERFMGLGIQVSGLITAFWKSLLSSDASLFGKSDRCTMSMQHISTAVAVTGLVSDAIRNSPDLSRKAVMVQDES